MTDRTACRWACHANNDNHFRQDDALWQALIFGTCKQETKDVNPLCCRYHIHLLVQTQYFQGGKDDLLVEKLVKSRHITPCLLW